MLKTIYEGQLLAKMENGQFGKTETDVVFVLNELQPYDNLVDGLTLKKDFQVRHLPIKANRPLLESMVNNLVVNALRHNEPNGTIIMTVFPHHAYIK